jgi:hypothetical protein
MWQMDEKWKESLDSPVAFMMPVVKKIFTSRRWWTLVPDQSVFASGVDQRARENLNVAARSADGDCIFIYLSSPATVSIQMDKITAGNQVKATWVNPQTGQETPAGEFPNTRTQTFTTPEGWPAQFLDAVLILEAVR